LNVINLYLTETIVYC